MRRGVSSEALRFIMGRRTPRPVFFIVQAHDDNNDSCIMRRLMADESTMAAGEGR